MGGAAASTGNDEEPAAIIGVAHPKWQERPLLIVVKRPGHEVTRQALLDFLASRVARWWLPDDVVFVDQLPHSATGKILKSTLREQFSEYRLPPASPCRIPLAPFGPDHAPVARAST